MRVKDSLPSKGGPQPQFLRSALLKMIFLFPRVGYVSSLEGTPTFFTCPNWSVDSGFPSLPPLRVIKSVGYLETSNLDVISHQGHHEVGSPVDGTNTPCIGVCFKPCINLPFGDARHAMYFDNGVCVFVDANLTARPEIPNAAGQEAKP